MEHSCAELTGCGYEMEWASQGPWMTNTSKTPTTVTTAAAVTKQQNEA